MKKKGTYTVSVVYPSTEEGMKLLEDRYASILANITAKRLNKEELKILIDRLEKQQQDK